MKKRFIIFALASVPLALGGQVIQESYTANWAINTLMPTSLQHHHDISGSTVVSSVSISSIPAFDAMLVDRGHTLPIGYTLQSIEVTFRNDSTNFKREIGAGTTNLRYTSLQTSSQPSLSGPGGLSLLGYEATASNTWPEFGIVISAGTKSTISPQLAQSAFASSVLLTGMQMDDFLGFGVVPFTVDHSTTASWTNFGQSAGSYARISGISGGAISVTYNFSPIPEPGTVVAGVLFAGLIGFVAVRRLRRKRAQ